MSAAEPKTKIPFMSVRYIFAGFSLVMFLYCCYVWNYKGADKFGIDFLGGTDLVLKFEEGVNASQIRANLKKIGFPNAIVQSFDSAEVPEFSIRIKGSDSSKVSSMVTSGLAAEGHTIEVLKNDFVGPVIGEKIKKDGFLAVGIALLGLLLYVGWRFHIRYGLGAILALTHDVFISAGIFLLLGGEIGASALAALLTILGYSVNDTIIVYDRIRENLNIKKRGSHANVGSLNLRKMSLSEIVDLSVNQTLSRTILTSGTTLFTCGALWYLGGGAIADLACILTIGVLTGTYSSIFVASPLILGLEKSK